MFRTECLGSSVITINNVSFSSVLWNNVNTITVSPIKALLSQTRNPPGSLLAHSRKTWQHHILNLVIFSGNLQFTFLSRARCPCRHPPRRTFQRLNPPGPPLGFRTAIIVEDDSVSSVPVFQWGWSDWAVSVVSLLVATWYRGVHTTTVHCSTVQCTLLYTALHYNCHLILT